MKKSLSIPSESEKENTRKGVFQTVSGASPFLDFFFLIVYNFVCSILC